jgi:hypothetical protein
MPSFPTIPIPTSASRIIPTSFPPSPTAAILFPPENYFRSLTISAFYVGLHLQTQRQGAIIADSKNCAIKSYCSKIVSRVLPSIINIEFLAFFLYSVSFYYISSVFLYSVIKNNSFCLLFNPALIAMLVPVSTLSPVSIQTWTPANFRDSIVVCTFF